MFQYLIGPVMLGAVLSGPAYVAVASVVGSGRKH